MRASRRNALAALLFALVSAAGCQCGPTDPGADAGGGDAEPSADGGGDGGNGSPTDGGVCSGVGVTCATATECCTGNCEEDASGQFRCAVGPTCTAAGNACHLAADCCSLNCVSGQCSATGLCLQTGDACSESDPSACCTGVCTGGVCAQPSMSACTVAGDPCSAAGSSSSCCSKACVDMDDGSGTDLRCASVGVCRSRGEPCVEASDCCSAVCGTNGVCAPPPVGGMCLVVGSACQATSDCCSGICANDGSGFNVCQYLGGCRPEEELCREETDCCGFYSAFKGTEPVCTLYGADGIGRCRVVDQGAPAGEICEGSKANSCAPSNAYCLESAAGIRRCAGECDGGPCATGNCIGDGEACLTPDQCCNRICAPQADGGFACAPGCLAVNDRCSTSADCCSGACSLAGFCETGGGVDGGAVCIPVSGACTASSECCSLFCEPSTMTCQGGIN